MKAQNSQLSITMFWNMGEAYPLLNVLEFAFLFWPPFVPENLPTLMTQVLHFSCSLFYPISSCYLTPFVHFYVGFTLFIVLLYFISQQFSFCTCTIFLWHAVSHSYNVMVSFAVFFVFVCHTAHCFLLLVCCILYMVKKHCPEEAHLNRWVKCQLIIKIARRTNLPAWFMFISLTYLLRYITEGKNINKSN